MARCHFLLMLSMTRMDLMVGAAETAGGYGGLAKNQSIIYAEIIPEIRGLLEESESPQVF